MSPNEGRGKRESYTLRSLHVEFYQSQMLSDTNGHCLALMADLIADFTLHRSGLIMDFAAGEYWAFLNCSP